MLGMEPDESTTPNFFSAIEISDRMKYMELKNQIAPSKGRCARGTRKENFTEILQAVKDFCIRNDDSDWKRCLVCGVAWTPEGIAINNRQFQMLMGKCKSSINGSLNRIGYVQSLGNSEGANIIARTLPELKHNYRELRQWTVRQNVSAVPKPVIPQINLDSLSNPPPRIEGSSQRLNDSLSIVPREPKMLPIFSIDKKKDRPWDLSTFNMRPMFNNIDFSDDIRDDDPFFNYEYNGMNWSDDGYNDL